MPKINIFEDNLIGSEEWQEKLRSKLEQILRVKGLETVRWDEHPEVQMNGIDAILRQETACLELKVREYWTHKLKDILLEIETGIDPQTHTGGKLGWFYTTKADLIVYVWKNESGSNLIDGYFIRVTEELRRWFEKNKHKFWEPRPSLSKSKRTGLTWLTRNKVVPIKEFPAGFLVRFSPTLTTSEQSLVERFLGDKERTDFRSGFLMSGAIAAHWFSEAARRSLNGSCWESREIFTFLRGEGLVPSFPLHWSELERWP